MSLAQCGLLSGQCYIEAIGSLCDALEIEIDLYKEELAAELVVPVDELQFNFDDYDSDLLEIIKEICQDFLGNIKNSVSFYSRQKNLTALRSLERLLNSLTCIVARYGMIRVIDRCRLMIGDIESKIQSLLDAGTTNEESEN